MMNKKNIVSVIALVAFANGSIVFGQEDAKVQKEEVVRTIAATVIALEKEALGEAQEVATEVTEVIEETTEEVVA